MLEVAFVIDGANWVVVSTSEDGVKWDGNSPVQGQSTQAAPSLSLMSFGANSFAVAFVANNDCNDLLVSSSADGINWDGNTQQGQASNTAPSLIGVSGLL